MTLIFKDGNIFEINVDEVEIKLNPSHHDNSFLPTHYLYFTNSDVDLYVYLSSWFIHREINQYEEHDKNFTIDFVTTTFNVDGRIISTPSSNDSNYFEIELYNVMKNDDDNLKLYHKKMIVNNQTNL